MRRGGDNDQSQTESQNDLSSQILQPDHGGTQVNSITSSYISFPLAKQDVGAGDMLLMDMRMIGGSCGYVTSTVNSYVLNQHDSSEESSVQSCHHAAHETEMPEISKQSSSFLALGKAGGLEGVEEKVAGGE